MYCAFAFYRAPDSEIFSAEGMEKAVGWCRRIMRLLVFLVDLTIVLLKYWQNYQFYLFFTNFFNRKISPANYLG